MLSSVMHALEARLASAKGIAHSMTTEGAGMQRALHSTRDRILELLVEIGSSMRQCKTLGLRLHSHIGSETMFSGGLFEARQALANLAAASDRMIDFTGSAEAMPDPELLARNYTMSAEREVHQRVLHGQAGAQASGNNDLGSGDLGDNVELF
jgi:hypothetical protein